MHDGGIGGEERPISSPRRSKGEVSVFAVHEVDRVKAAKLVPDRPGDEAETARDNGYFAYSIATPAAK
jgi:hypothetical protein